MRKKYHLVIVGMHPIIITFLFILFCTNTVWSAEGDLDISFGVGGIVTTNLVGSNSDYARDVAIQSDRKILVAGYSSTFEDNDFAVARYNQNGSLDAGFGSGGIVIIDLGTTYDLAYAVILQEDEKIVLVGTSYNGFALVRLNQNGGLDSSFGNDGIVITNFGVNSRAFSAEIQEDGKILVAGHISSSSSPGDDFALARYNSDGSLDTDFGNSGLVETDFDNSGLGNWDYAQAIETQADGKIIVVGYTYISSFDSNFDMARYNYDGSLDVSFGSGGKISHDFGSLSCRAFTVRIQADNKILVGGQIYGSSLSTNNFFVSRYNTDGYIDPNFGQGGIVETDFNNSRDFGEKLILQPDGKIILVGYTGGIYGGTENFALARYEDNGILDVTFGNGGLVVTNIYYGDHAYSAAIQKDGRILAAGYSNTGSTNTGTDFSLARYEAYTTPGEEIQQIADALIIIELPQGTESSLSRILDAASNALTDENQNNDASAINSLKAFINAVEAQRGKTLTDEEANLLIAYAEEAISSLTNE